MQHKVMRNRVMQHALKRGMQLGLWMAIALLLALPCQAGAQCTQTLRVGIAERGFTSYRSAGGYAGISVDIFNEMGRRSGCKIALVWLPNVRLMLELADGRLDAVASLPLRAGRDGIAVHLAYGAARYQLVVSRRLDGRLRSLDDFVRHSTGRLNLVRGLVAGSAIAPHLRELERQGRLEFVSDFSALFRKMAAGRADAVLASPEVLRFHLPAAGLTGQVTLLPVPELPACGIGPYLSRSTLAPATIATLQAALAAMLGDGTVAAIQARYARRYIEPREPREPRGPI